MMMGTTSLLLKLGGAVAAGAVVAAAAGCSSGGSSSSSAPAATSAAASASSAAPSSAAATPTASPTASSGAASPNGVTASASATTGGGGGAADGCATRDLQIKAGSAQGAAGSLYQELDFTNIGTAACTLYGYPGVSLAAGNPVTQVGAAATRSTVAGPALVTLQPGEIGNALLRITQALNYPASTCSPASTTYLVIYPPNQTTPDYLAYKSMGCRAESVKLLTIGVVQPGANSSQ
jgi:Protein of unknown function (DUF4232)